MELGLPTKAQGSRVIIWPEQEMYVRVWTMVRTALVLLAILVVVKPVGPRSCNGS
jgi:hypothetical protein